MQQQFFEGGEPSGPEPRFIEQWYKSWQEKYAEGPADVQMSLVWDETELSAARRLASEATVDPRQAALKQQSMQSPAPSTGGPWGAPKLHETAPTKNFGGSALTKLVRETKASATGADGAPSDTSPSSISSSLGAMRGTWNAASRFELSQIEINARAAAEQESVALDAIREWAASGGPNQGISQMMHTVTGLPRMSEKRPVGWGAAPTHAVQQREAYANAYFDPEVRPPPRDKSIPMNPPPHPELVHEVPPPPKPAAPYAVITSASKVGAKPSSPPAVPSTPKSDPRQLSKNYKIPSKPKLSPSSAVDQEIGNKLERQYKHVLGTSKVKIQSTGTNPRRQDPVRPAHPNNF